MPFVSASASFNYSDYENIIAMFSRKVAQKKVHCTFRSSSQTIQFFISSGSSSFSCNELLFLRLFLLAITLGYFNNTHLIATSNNNIISFLVFSSARHGIL